MGASSFLLDVIRTLIIHIRNSKANQEAIFNTLRPEDFKRMVDYLDDQDTLVRTAALNLIIELLAGNSKLKRKYCEIMNISLFPGKIILNSKTLEKNLIQLLHTDFTHLLKSQTNSAESNCLMWYIDISKQSEKYEIKYINNQTNNSYTQIELDPRKCIVGFCLSKYAMLNFSIPQFLCQKKLRPIKQPSFNQVQDCIQSNPQIKSYPYLCQNSFKKKSFPEGFTKDSLVLPITNISKVKRKFSKNENPTKWSVDKQKRLRTEIQPIKIPTQQKQPFNIIRTERQAIEEVILMPGLNLQNCKNKKPPLNKRSENENTSTADGSVDEITFKKSKPHKTITQNEAEGDKNSSFLKYKSTSLGKRPNLNMKINGFNNNSSKQIHACPPTERSEKTDRTFHIYNWRTQAQRHKTNKQHFHQLTTRE